MVRILELTCLVDLPTSRDILSTSEDTVLIITNNSRKAKLLLRAPTSEGDSFIGSYTVDKQVFDHQQVSCHTEPDERAPKRRRRGQDPALVQSFNPKTSTAQISKRALRAPTVPKPKANGRGGGKLTVETFHHEETVNKIVNAVLSGTGALENDSKQLLQWTQELETHRPREEPRTLSDLAQHFDNYASSTMAKSSCASFLAGCAIVASNDQSGRVTQAKAHKYGSTERTHRLRLRRFSICLLRLVNTFAEGVSCSDRPKAWKLVTALTAAPDLPTPQLWVTLEHVDEVMSEVVKRLHNNGWEHRELNFAGLDPVPELLNTELSPAELYARLGVSELLTKGSLRLQCTANPSNATATSQCTAVGPTSQSAQLSADPSNHIADIEGLAGSHGSDSQLYPDGSSTGQSGTVYPPMDPAHDGHSSVVNNSIYNVANQGSWVCYNEGATDDFENFASTTTSLPGFQDHDSQGLYNDYQAPAPSGLSVWDPNTTLEPIFNADDATWLYIS